MRFDAFCPGALSAVRVPFVFAKIGAEGRERAGIAGRPLRMADLSSVPDEPVMRLRPIFFGNERHEPLFHFEGRFAGGEPQAVGDAEDVRIDGDGVCPPKANA